MIGPGTGIAPMRALLQDRKFQYEQQQKQQQQNKSVAMRNTLYFGCKHANVDYIYKDELSVYVFDQTLTSLHLAFSRDQQQKVYVQNLIMQAENAKALIEDVCVHGAYVYVCGATSMGNDVNEAIINVMHTYKGMSKEAATEFVKKLQTSGKYVQELWSA